MTFITRAQWGARTPRSTGNAISAHPLGVAVHYSAANLGSSPDSLCDDKVRGIQNYHIDHNGWADLAYTFLVCPHGNIYEGRGTGKGSAANGTTVGNLNWYAVCALGGPKDTPSVLMLAGIGTAIGLCRKAGASSRVIGHRDLFATACPGVALYAYVTAGRWAKLVVKIKVAVITTAKKIVAKVTPKPAYPGYVTSVKSHGVYVSRMIQTRLKSLNYPIVVDGDFGPQTAKWVGLFQSRHHLAADGVVGALTWRALWA